MRRSQVAWVSPDAPRGCIVVEVGVESEAHVPLSIGLKPNSSRIRVCVGVCGLLICLLIRPRINSQSQF